MNVLPSLRRCLPRVLLLVLFLFAVTPIPLRAHSLEATATKSASAIHVVRAMPPATTMSLAAWFQSRPTRTTIIRGSIVFMAIALFIMLRK